MASLHQHADSRAVIILTQKGHMPMDTHDVRTVLSRLRRLPGCESSQLSIPAGQSQPVHFHKHSSDLTEPSVLTKYSCAVGWHTLVQR